MGLREQIKNAESEAEINVLLSKGNAFEYASNKTKNAWKSTAKFRMMKFNNSIPVQSDTAQTDLDLSVKKKTKTKNNSKKK
jgi:hypothetical protein